MKFCMYCNGVYDNKKFDYNGYCCYMHKAFLYNIDYKIVNETIANMDANAAYNELSKSIASIHWDQIQLLIDRIIGHEEAERNFASDYKITSFICYDKIIEIMNTLSTENAMIMLSNLPSVYTMSLMSNSAMLRNDIADQILALEVLVKLQE